jgi:hypothetical protein
MRQNDLLFSLATGRACGSPALAAASFTPILGGLAGIVQWIYYPARRSDF